MPLVVDNLKTKVITVGENVESVGCYSTIGGGLNNTSLTDYSIIAGGLNNTITTSSNYYTGCNTISGGYSNIIAGISCSSTIGGGRRNTTLGRYSTISGGRRNEAGVIGVVDGWSNVQYSGSLNTGGPFGPYSPTSASTISGYGVEFEFYFYGGGNVGVNIFNGGSGYVDGDVLVFNGNLFPSGTTSADTITLIIGSGDYGYATVGGGRENTASGEYSTISGGYENTASGYASTISGGYQNEAYASYTTISGGYQNTAICRYATISGGYSNSAFGSCSTISGGYYNTVSSEYGGILGGSDNSVSHNCSFIVGDNINTVAQCTLHVNCLHFSSIPTSDTGLCAGTVWNDSGTLKIKI